MKTFIVSRKRWYRGKGEGGSALRLKNGMQCCLGFVGRQVGCRAKDMVDISMPYTLEGKLLAKFPQLGRIYDWALFSQINDNPKISDKTRETKLKALAKEHGFQFKFVP